MATVLIWDADVPYHVRVYTPWEWIFEIFENQKFDIKQNRISKS